ncbi:reverse transcriptase domain-containing protein [Tanacetum coccineum]
MSSSMSAADNPKALFLNELELGITGTIVVMIWMMWDVYAATGRYLSTDFIVSDTQGNVMHCTTKGSIDHNFLRLKEGFVYLVKNFTIAPNKDEIRVIIFDDFMLEFDGETTFQKAFLKSNGFTHYPFQLVEIDELEPTNNKYLIDRLYLSSTSSTLRFDDEKIPLLMTDRLYISNTSSTLRFDDEKIPLLMRLKTDDSGVALTKEILLADNTMPKAINFFSQSATFLCEVTIDKVRTKKGWNYPWSDSCNSSIDYPIIRYRLELEISDKTAEVVVVMFDETTRVLLKCSVEKASLGLPPALANIVGTSHALEIKFHMYYEHVNYESFTCWKVVIDEDVVEGASSATAAANEASKASELKRLNKAPAIATPSKPGEEKKRMREELEDSDTEASFVADSQSKGGDVACSSDTRKRKRIRLSQTTRVEIVPEKTIKQHINSIYSTPEVSAFFAGSDILCSQSLGKYEFRWECFHYLFIASNHFCTGIHVFFSVMPPRNNHADRPSLSNILHTSVMIHSNTIIRHDGTVQSFCGLKLSDIGKKRTTKKARKPAALSSTGTEVSCHNLGALTYQCRGCNAVMWYRERNNKGNKDANPTFSLCYQQGKVLLSRFNEAPTPLNRLLDYNQPTTSSFRDQNIIELCMLSERTNSRQYNTPTVGEVAALIANDFGDDEPTRDIIVNKKDSEPKRISELHTSYMALQYPLLFLYGEDGYHDKISYHTNTRKHKTSRGYVTMKEYYAYVIQYKKEQRLSWTRNNQDTLRVDLYHNVCDAVTRGDTNAAGLGKRIILPHNFTSGPRYMMQNYQDAMALCRAYGNPDMFITFTSNPKWLEISEMLTYIPGQRAHDRPEVGTRVFKLKLLNY